MDYVYVCRILSLLFHLILTALRRIFMMLLWKTVGMHVLSCSSGDFCFLSMKGCPRTVRTKQVQVYTCICMTIHVCVRV